MLMIESVFDFEKLTSEFALPDIELWLRDEDILWMVRFWMEDEFEPFKCDPDGWPTWCDNELFDLVQFPGECICMRVECIFVDNMEWVELSMVNDGYSTVDDEWFVLAGVLDDWEWIIMDDIG